MQSYSLPQSGAQPEAHKCNVFLWLKSCIKAKIGQLYPDIALEISQFNIEIPKDTTHGDASTNAAMVLSKLAGENPRQIAEKIATALREGEGVDSVEVAGPGFINLKLSRNVWQQFLANALQEGRKYGNLKELGKDKKVSIEFVSANPTGPMHIGHARGAIVGDAIARLLAKCGYGVTKEYYINDAGSQIDTLANSVLIRYKQALGIDEKIPEGAYPGEYLIPLGSKLAEMHGNKLLSMHESERAKLLKEFAVNEMMQLIREDLKLLKVEHDVFISERKDIHEKAKIEKSIELLKTKGLIYRGILEAPKGKLPDDWEPREQELFSSTKFGDDTDRPLTKSDGAHTYFAADIAYHYDKLQRGFNDLILLLGADHAGYVKRMKAAVGALSDNKAELDIKINQLVNLFKNGEPYKMSKRTGNFLTVRDVVEELGADVLRFMMLTRKSDTVFDFHLEKALEQNKDNPVFYVQYAHARAHSVLRIAKEQGFKAELSNINMLIDPYDLGLIKKIAEYPKVLESACLSHEPHKVTFYLIELANEFHSYWAKGNENADMRFILVGNPQLTSAKLNMVQALIYTIASGLDVLGVAAVESM